MLKLEDITWDNFGAVISLKLESLQERFTKPNSIFIAQGYVNVSMNYLNTLKAVTIDNTVIGFAKWVDLPKHTAPYHLTEDATLIDALMIDKAYQGKGLGKQALDLIIESIKED